MTIVPGKINAATAAKRQSNQVLPDAVSISPAFLLAVWPVFLSLLGHGFWAQYTRSAYAATGVIDVWLWFLHLGVVGIVALWEMRKVLGTCSRDDAG
ncbi:MAG TPA: hypothetical protein QGI30_02050, partial [Anaerolineales bacterium]|nr:hypothetical protein [Anaerolineales bacterium]